MIEINEAGLMNFLRTILILVVAYYVIKILVKLFAPYLLKKVVTKVQKRTAQQFQQQQDNVETGKTVVDKKPHNVQQNNTSIGEYVDFEEID